jgi:16S rRNA (cytidine1402-2'-O)-methyltransferase
MATLFVTGLPLRLEKHNFSPNSLNILKTSNHLIGESRKVILSILSFIGDKNKSFSLLNEHSKYDEKKELLNLIKAKDISVLFSDIGTPCVADPGYDFIDMCYNNNIKILSLPGPSCITSELSIAGFYSEKFFFAGYPPIEKGERKNFFIELNRTRETTVFIERPYCMKNLLKDLQYIKDKRMAITYNIGSHDEITIRGNINNIKNKLINMPKAPFTVVVEGIK